MGHEFSFWTRLVGLDHSLAGRRRERRHRLRQPHFQIARRPEPGATAARPHSKQSGWSRNLRGGTRDRRRRARFVDVAISQRKSLRRRLGRGGRRRRFYRSALQSRSRFLFLHILLRRRFTGTQSGRRRCDRAASPLQPAIPYHVSVLLRESLQRQILLYGRRRSNVGCAPSRCKQLFSRFGPRSLSRSRVCVSEPALHGHRRQIRSEYDAFLWPTSRCVGESPVGGWLLRKKKRWLARTLRWIRSGQPDSQTNFARPAALVEMRTDQSAVDVCSVYAHLGSTEFRRLSGRSVSSWLLARTPRWCDCRGLAAQPTDDGIVLSRRTEGEELREVEAGRENGRRASSRGELQDIAVGRIEVLHHEEIT